MQLHVIDFILLDDEKSTTLIAASNIQAGFQAPTCHFSSEMPREVTIMFINQIVTACEMSFIAYYHNEAAHKDVCDSHLHTSNQS